MSLTIGHYIFYILLILFMCCAAYVMKLTLDEESQSLNNKGEKEDLAENPINKERKRRERK